MSSQNRTPLNKHHLIGKVIHESLLLRRVLNVSLRYGGTLTWDGAGLHDCCERAASPSADPATETPHDLHRHGQSLVMLGGRNRRLCAWENACHKF